MQWDGDTVRSDIFRNAAIQNLIELEDKRAAKNWPCKKE